ncbi:MAG: SURF1 family protein [Actinomycetota bacterium]
MRFLLSPRWLIRHVLAILVIATCVVLASWQVDRLKERRELNAHLQSQTRIPAAELEEVIARPEREAQYRLVTVEGTYDSAHEVLLQSRSLDKRTGNHLLTPLVTASGTALIVDRGWVPLEIDEPGGAETLAPTGQVRLTGYLLLNERSGPFGVSDPPPGTVRALPRVDLVRLDQQLTYPVHPLYLRLVEQSPAASGEFPVLAPLASFDEGPHFDYALQWSFFALVASIVYLALLRKELRARRVPPESLPEMASELLPEVESRNFEPAPEPAAGPEQLV